MRMPFTRANVHAVAAWITSEPRSYAATRRGWLFAHRIWLLRRLSQTLVLALFLVGPWYGIWLAKGNFASSEILGLIPLADPFIFVQSLFALHKPILLAVIGVATIVALYLLVGGRVYCSWVCPVNVVTDSAYWLRDKLGLTRDRKLDRRTRIWVLVGALLASFMTGTIAWEFLNPVSLLQRGIIFGIGAGWGIIAAVFMLDLFVTRRGWCSHLCPVGAFYGLIGAQSLVRVSALQRTACTDCGACFKACPEPHVIMPALKGKGTHLILSGDCTNCGACIDSCYVDVFQYGSRLSPKHAAPEAYIDPPASPSRLPARTATVAAE
jgi:ferredoxin-type protein NapH